MIDPPKKAAKKKKKKKGANSKVVKVVTERIEKAFSDSENSDDDNTTRQKARASNLPPPEILFAHLNRVETMKIAVEPAITDMGSRTPKRSATFSMNSFHADAVVNNTGKSK